MRNVNVGEVIDNSRINGWYSMAPYHHRGEMDKIWSLLQKIKPDFQPQPDGVYEVSAVNRERVSLRQTLRLEAGAAALSPA